MEEELSKEEREQIRKELEKEEKRKKTVKIQNRLIIGVIAVAGLIALIIGGYMLYGYITTGKNPFATEVYKPVIYLYPEKEAEVLVHLNPDGKLTCTYPKYENGWKVIAAPDGTLTDEKGMSYNYLYWEGELTADYDFSAGFCVKGSDTAEFLEGSLEQLGLTRREANEFIVYWLPLMENNEYNLISFQTDAYTDHAKLSIDPEPDTLIRVFMAWKGCKEPTEIPEQTLTAPERTGFTVVEWGGSEVR